MIITNYEGQLRVEGTRVPIETVIWSFLEGVTISEISERFSSVTPDKAQAVIDYYLDHQAEIDTYLNQVRHEIRNRDNGNLYADLIARRNAGQPSDLH